MLSKLNPRLIVARMTSFRRDGKYTAMAGHDTSYPAVSGVLPQLGRKDSTPHPPTNLLQDLGGGGLVCFVAIVMTMLQRQERGSREVAEPHVVDEAAHLGIMLRFAGKNPMWDRPRGWNPLSGGCPYYDTHECKDGRYMAV